MSKTTSKKPLGQLVIRLLQDDDSIEELASLLNNAYKALKPRGLNYAATTQNPDDTRKRIQNKECFIALLDDVVVGTILYVSREKKGSLLWYDHPDVAVFFQVAVHPDWQSCGIARKLFDYVEKKAASEGAIEIAADTAAQATDLLKMYKKRGYRTVDYTYWKNTNYRSVVFSKRLCDSKCVTVNRFSQLKARWRAKLRQLIYRLTSR